MNIFVSKEDQVEVPVYVWEENSKVEAGLENKDGATKYVFIFRKPNFQDSTRILSRSQRAEGDANVAVFQDSVFRTLLLKINSQTDAFTASETVINDLDPVVARSALGGLLNRISI